MAAPERELKMVLAGLGIILVALGGGWFWILRHTGAVQEAIRSSRQLIGTHESKTKAIRKEVDEFEQSGAKAYYYRMLPDPRDLRYVETLRILADLEEEAGVHIIKGVRLFKPKGRDAGKSPHYDEHQFTVSIRADYGGLVRFVDGLEREADRDGKLGGGRLFEVKEIKTDLKPVDEDASPPWKLIYMQDTELLGPKRTFDVTVAVYTLKG